ncbi:MAG: sulfatase-like hydrolase/transferase [Clostridia bacterium]|nr:sulfatase-like hydrolase/transferase [Clostridia bacterium]
MNFLLINADQLRHDAVGYRGLRPVKTPHLDRLAEESVDFAEAFTPLPVCSPARQSLLCGRHPDSFGAQWNYDFIPTPRLDPAWCWPKELERRGWNTGYVGSFHVIPERDARPYGYRDFVSSSEHKKLLAEKYPDAEFSGGWFGCESPIPLEDSATHWTARKATALLEKYAAEAKPWHLWVDFEEPHLPCRPSAPFAGMYDPASIPPWDGYGDDFHLKPYIHRQQTWSWDTEACTWEKDWAPMVARYFGVVSQLDDAVGRILDCLRKTGQWDDTAVVFTSDHGDMCGSHNMLDKHYVLYDDIIRVPFLAKVPGVPPRVSREFVQNTLDLPASLPGWLGFEKPPVLHGRPLPLEKREESGRETVVSTSNGQQFGLYTARAIRTKRWKYVWNLTDVDELYDLEADPGEKENRVSDPALSGLISDLRSRLWEDLSSHGDPFTRSAWLKHQLLDGKIVPPGFSGRENP